MSNLYEEIFTELLIDAFGFGMGTFRKEARVNMAKGFGAGIAGATINFGTAQGAKNLELADIKARNRALVDAIQQDNKNNIQVIAKNH